jgi:hypothetical protein
MDMKYYKWIIIISLLIGCLILVGNALSANGYIIGRSVIGGGGREGSGGNFVLNGTIAEPIASNLEMEPSYGLSSGFWWETNYQIYLPMTLRE